MLNKITETTDCFICNDRSCDQCKQVFGDLTCEYCDKPITEDEAMPGYDRAFCCDDCAIEYSENELAARAEDVEQWKLYGDDLHSWYR